MGRVEGINEQGGQSNWGTMVVKRKLGFILSMEGSLGRMACWEVMVLIKMKNKHYRGKRWLGKGPHSPKVHSRGRATELYLVGCGWPEWLLAMNVGRD